MNDRRPEDSRIVGLENRMTALENGLKTNTDLTNQIKADTSDIVSLLKGSKVAITVIKWVGILATGVLAIWAAIDKFAHLGK